MEIKQTSELNLETLAVAAQKHASDRAAGQQFFKNIYPFVRHVCVRTVVRRSSRQRAFDFEDLVQAVCVKIWTSLENFDPAKGRFSTWVWTLARHTWTDLAFSKGDCSSELVGIDEGMPVDASGVDERVDARQSLELIKGALPAAALKLIVMNGVGHSAYDIAGLQGANVETVKSRIRVAREKAFACVGVVTGLSHVAA